MCGIVGVVGDATIDLAPALKALAHRGPDGAGVFRRGGVTFGHRRLSIIDLGDAASQPMARDGAGAISYNGELYDFVAQKRALEARGVAFDSRSDTEVLLRGLALDGVGFLRGLHGMYAFAWCDETAARVILARDHAGMKPLYYWRGPRAIAFASEVRALATVIRALGGDVRLNPRALSSLLAYGAVSEPDTIINDVEVLPPASALEIEVGTLHTRVTKIDHAKEPAAPVEEAVRAAAARHLVSDRPVALFLSSGIDSGVLAVECARAEIAPEAITVALGGPIDDEPAIAARLASRLGLRARIIPVEDWTRRLDGVLDAYDQPSTDGLNTYVVAGVAKELGYRVALSGVGADEVFGGYPFLRRRLPPVPRAAARLAPFLLQRSMPALHRAGALLDGVARGQPAQRSFRRILADAEIRALAPALPLPLVDAPDEDPLALERRTYLCNTLLRDADALGMAHSVEIRAPYLDPAVLAAAAAIGWRALLDGEPKWPLREGWGARLDPATLARRKTGFQLDVGAWLRGRGAPLVENAREALLRSPLFDRPALEAAWSRWRARIDHPAMAGALFAMVQLHEQLARWGA